MQVTIDVSMYPNKEDFIPPIKGFIEKINTYKNIKFGFIITIFTKQKFSVHIFHIKHLTIPQEIFFKLQHIPLKSISII